MEFARMSTEDMGKHYSDACIAMQVNLSKLLGRSVDDPEVIEFGHSLLLAVKWQQEYSMGLAMDLVNKEFKK